MLLIQLNTIMVNASSRRSSCGRPENRLERATMINNHLSAGWSLGLFVAMLTIIEGCGQEEPQLPEPPSTQAADLPALPTSTPVVEPPHEAAILKSANHQNPETSPSPIPPTTVPATPKPSPAFPPTATTLTQPTEPETPHAPPTTITSSGPATPVFLPLADAVAGEWVRLAGLEDREVYYEITTVRAATVTVQVTSFQKGERLGLPVTREEFRHIDPLEATARHHGAKRSCTRTTIQAAGHDWDTLLYEDRWIDEAIHYVRRTWVSPFAPIFGMVRMELYGDDLLEARLELIAWGKRPSSETQSVR